MDKRMKSEQDEGTRRVVSGVKGRQNSRRDEEGKEEGGRGRISGSRMKRARLKKRGRKESGQEERRGREERRQEGGKIVHAAKEVSGLLGHNSLSASQEPEKRVFLHR
ncbi:hypothetical protein E2C01_037873 [Portunus trituberculatus]|uniref:Uncharacterized protein n=1 Tax=Portunus trituberculatus TaxID=210409 RepID=A0A5B7FFA1_PORTR|nr:hypothetical protein [Portunus trituberculatus]